MFNDFLSSCFNCGYQLYKTHCIYPEGIGYGREIELTEFYWIDPATLKEIETCPNCQTLLNDLCESAAISPEDTENIVLD